MLLTTESVKTYEATLKVIQYYELRWRIEEFHKAWKTGAGAERQRMQSAENLERMIVILSAIAVRLLRLKESLEKDNNPDVTKKLCCTQVLTQDEYRLLWFSIQPKNKKKKPLPSKIPSLEWAYRAVAKLGGWNDSKKTGKASWQTLWKGWFALQERLDGYLLAKEVAEL